MRFIAFYLHRVEYPRGETLPNPSITLDRVVGFSKSPGIHFPVSAIRTPKFPLLPVWEKGVGGMRGTSARECRLPFWASGRPYSPFSPCGRRRERDAHRGRFFGKPLRAISRFGHQNAQTPLSPLVGEGGRGMLTGVDFLASPCVPSPVSAIRTPRLPLLPLWEKV